MKTTCPEKPCTHTFTQFLNADDKKKKRQARTHTHIYTHGLNDETWQQRAKTIPWNMSFAAGICWHACGTYCACLCTCGFPLRLCVCERYISPVASGMLTVARCRFVPCVYVQYRLQRQQSCVWCRERWIHRAVTHLREIRQQSARYPEVFDNRLIISVVFQAKI